LWKGVQGGEEVVKETENSKKKAQLMTPEVLPHPVCPAPCRVDVPAKGPLARLRAKQKPKNFSGE